MTGLYDEGSDRTKSLEVLQWNVKAEQKIVVPVEHSPVLRYMDHAIVG